MLSPSFHLSFDTGALKRQPSCPSTIAKQQAAGTLFSTASIPLSTPNKPPHIRIQPRHCYCHHRITAVSPKRTATLVLCTSTFRLWGIHHASCCNAIRTSSCCNRCSLSCRTHTAWRPVPAWSCAVSHHKRGTSAIGGPWTRRPLPHLPQRQRQLDCPQTRQLCSLLFISHAQH